MSELELLAADTEARRIIRESLDESLLVEAAAGTGKTTELVARVVEVLRSGRARIDEVVAVTFTKKAAGELKLRLRQALDRARESSTSTARENIEEAIAHLEEARVGTIHAFAAEILRERPVEAKVDPRFAELAENEALALYDRAFSRWMEAKLSVLPGGLRRALSRRVQSWDSKTAVEKLKASAWRLIEWRDFDAPWRRDPAFSRDAEVLRLWEQVRNIADLSSAADSPKDDLFTATLPLRVFVERFERTLSTRVRDLDALEAALIALGDDLSKFKRTGRGRYSATVTREAVVQAKQALEADLEAFKIAAEADLAAELQREIAPLIGEYQALKARSGRLDFVDLLICVRDLLRSDGQVRGYLRERFARVFVDEFQDTDPLQAEILLLLAADDPSEMDWRKVRPTPGKLFLVGDPKQSIYRFRRADIVLYQSVKTRLVEQGVRLIHLSRSFRSNAAIQSAVNAAFEPAMQEDPSGAQSGYVPLVGGPPGRAEQPAVIALPAPTPYGYRGVEKAPLAKCLPPVVGAFVAWLVNESGWKVREGAEEVDVAPRHVAILFRSYMSAGRDLTRPYTEALEAHGIPHILVAGKSFHQREEVESLRAALAAIEWPDDALSVYATLRGPLFAVSDETLLAFREKVGRIHPFGPRPAQEESASEDATAEGLAAASEALDLLKELHRLRSTRPIAETIGELLTQTRAHAGFAMRTHGDQALANVQRVIEMGRAFEMEGGLSFRGFVERLTREAESERASEAPLLEEGAEGVRIMTVHAAKGLEFPVVILGDMNANLSHRDPDRFVDPERRLYTTKVLDCVPYELRENRDLEHARERAEGARVAYVAATRAKDLLVVPAVGIGPEPAETWYAPVFRALFPSKATRRERHQAPGCPTFFGDTTVLQEPPRSGVVDKGVAPGLHTAEHGGHPVVWWDPRHLSLNRVAEPRGLRGEKLLTPSEAEAEAEGLETYFDWKEQREAAHARGVHRSIAPFSASDEDAPAPPTLVGSIDEVQIPKPRGRPSGRRFGTLVHAVLREAPFDADTARLAALAELEGRMLGAPREEVRAAIGAASAALAHPILARARAARRALRELPILYRTPGGEVLDGTMDLCFLEDDGWVVVDFKTDVDVELRRKLYLKQMRWYLLAFSKAMGAPARGVLLGV